MAARQSRTQRRWFGAGEKMAEYGRYGGFRMALLRLPPYPTSQIHSHHSHLVPLIELAQSAQISSRIGFRPARIMSTSRRGHEG